MTHQKIKLIYILGSGHSGSTLTDLILGSHGAIESVGEFFQFPQYFSPQTTRPEAQRICTCGVPISQCEYWNQILKRVDNPLFYEIDSKENFAQNNYDLFKAILEFTNKSIVLDSSKILPRLQRLIKSGCFEITVLHLVRDGRAVGYSSKRKERKLKDKFGSSYSQELSKMNKSAKTYNFYYSVRNWNRDNVIYYQKFHQDSRVRYFTIKYEDLVRNTEETIANFLKNFNLEFELQQLQFSEQEHHNIDGNRMRLAKGGQITLDQEYKHRLSSLEWWGSTGITYQGLRLFDYPLRKMN